MTYSWYYTIIQRATRGKLQVPTISQQISTWHSCLTSIVPNMITNNFCTLPFVPSAAMFIFKMFFLVTWSIFSSDQPSNSPPLCRACFGNDIPFVRGSCVTGIDKQGVSFRVKLKTPTDLFQKKHTYIYRTVMPHSSYTRVTPPWLSRSACILTGRPLISQLSVHVTVHCTAHITAWLNWHWMLLAE